MSAQATLYVCLCVRVCSEMHLGERININRSLTQVRGPDCVSGLAALIEW